MKVKSYKILAYHKTVSFFKALKMIGIINHCEWLSYRFASCVKQSELFTIKKKTLYNYANFVTFFNDKKTKGIKMCSIKCVIILVLKGVVYLY